MKEASCRIVTVAVIGVVGERSVKVNKFDIIAECFYAALDKRVSWEHFKRVKAELLEED
jgi:hypothetical protein